MRHPVPALLARVACDAASNNAASWSTGAKAEENVPNPKLFQ